MMIKLLWFNPHILVWKPWTPPMIQAAVSGIDPTHPMVNVTIARYKSG